MKRIVCLFALILMLSCNKEELSPPSIDEELKPFIDRFYDEAEQRGISLIENMDAFLRNDPTACGQGHAPDYNGMFSKPTIIIDKDCWENLNDTAKEILIFHELGHALLNRIHIDGMLPNGHSKSIMCAGVDFDCSDLPDYLYCPDYRAYYVNELFDANTSAPGWSTRDWEIVNTVFSDYNSDFSNDWQVFTNCETNSFQVSIDSTSQNRPSDYSLRLFSECNDVSTVRKRIAIGNFTSVDAIRLKCDFYHNLTGDGFQAGIFVKDKDNSFSTFNRTTNSKIIDLSNNIKDFTLQAECLTTDADSLIISFNFLPNTAGEIFIGNLDIQLME